MAKVCPTCRITSVQFAGTICAKCRAKGKVALENARVTVVIPGQEVDPLLVINEQLHLLHTQQLALRSLQQATEADGYRMDLAKEMRELSANISSVIKEWRQTERDGKKRVAGMDKHAQKDVFTEWVLMLPKDEQIETFVDWVSRMPEEVQLRVAEALAGGR